MAEYPETKCFVGTREKRMLLHSYVSQLKKKIIWANYLTKVIYKATKCYNNTQNFYLLYKSEDICVSVCVCVRLYDHYRNPNG